MQRSLRATVTPVFAPLCIFSRFIFLVCLAAEPRSAATFRPELRLNLLTQNPDNMSNLFLLSGCPPRLHDSLYRIQHTRDSRPMQTWTMLKELKIQFACLFVWLIFFSLLSRTIKSHTEQIIIPSLSVFTFQRERKCSRASDDSRPVAKEVWTLDPRRVACKSAISVRVQRVCFCESWICAVDFSPLSILKIHK